MRLHFPALVLAVIIFSCNNANTDKQNSADTTQNKTETSRTISDAISELKTTLESNDRDKIAGLFTFPIPDTIMAVYLDDSVFKKNYTAAGDQLTKNMFLTYYDTIARYTNLRDIIVALKSLPVDSLRYLGKIETDISAKREPCVAFCSIEVNGNDVTLKYSTIANDEYVKPKGSSEDDESEVAGCEYASFFMFVFDGNKLRFVRYAAAG